MKPMYRTVIEVTFTVEAEGEDEHDAAENARDLIEKGIEQAPWLWEHDYYADVRETIGEAY